MKHQGSQRTRYAAAKGFTLLEVLVVLTIIGLIVGLVGSRVIGKGDDAKVKTAQTQVRLLQGALDAFQLDMNRYPTTEEGLSVLVTPPKDGDKQRWKGPYINNAQVPMDPWEHAYQYSVPGAKGMPFALYSFGADGQKGGEGNNADVGILPPG
ncbi:type II secretion system major pseudopilin GspG [Burkholderiaceae bacterium DAT-1]|nr:type II secretion system major pseudopilin GspG [Burkholderiaceae bacterium DAT-1]